MNRPIDAASFVLGLAVMTLAAVFFFGEAGDEFNTAPIGIIAIAACGSAFLASGVQMFLRDRRSSSAE